MARSNKTRTLVAFATVGALVLGTYQLGSALLSDDSLATQHLANQVWIERLPQNDRDMINHIVLVEDGRERFGAFGKSSQWRHFVEIFRWAREENRLSLLLPQDRKRLDLGVRVWDCEDEAPAPFQLCLELSNKSHKILYYSRHDWTLDSLGEHPELTAVIATPAPVPAIVDADAFVVSDDFIE
jgi:hypothetical protein